MLVVKSDQVLPLFLDRVCIKQEKGGHGCSDQPDQEAQSWVPLAHHFIKAHTSELADNILPIVAEAFFVTRPRS